MILDRFPTVDVVKSIIENIPDEEYRNAFKYMFLIAGRVSEVCGKYSPLGKHAFRCEIEGEEAVLFAVKTARKTKNPYRAAAFPLEGHPWAQEVLEYFERTPNEHPFVFGDQRPINYKSNVRYLQWETEKRFSDLEWPVAKYWVTRERTSEDNEEMGIIFELANRGQISVEYSPSPTESVSYDEHIRPFTSMCLRYMRAFDLLMNFQFNPIELSIFGGWKTSTLSVEAPSFIHRLFGFGSAEPPLEFLIMMARIYFRQFLQ